jgi:hypothetical protein
MRWHIEDIDLSRIDVERAAANEDLMLVLCVASFVESGSDLYSRNLGEFFRGDEEVCGWLLDEWEAEELQHGRALKAYIGRVWPGFDWDATFRGFFDEYSRTCSPDQLEPTQALELVARCVIETGTSTLYRTITACSDEPVLTEIASHIHADEVHHYKYFYRYFQKYNEAERQGRFAIFRALARRVAEIRAEDEEIAMRHVLAALYPDRAGDAAFNAERVRRARALVARDLPFDMSVKMLLKPLDLPASLQRGLVFVATRAARALSRHVFAG